MAFDTSQALSIQAARTINVGRGNGGGSTPVPETATKFYELTFSGNMPNNIGAGNAHPGGGYISFLGDPNPGQGLGIANTNIYFDTISDDPIFTGNIPVLRNTYFADGASYNFANQTLFGSHPESRRIYKRLRIKWSSNWEWGSDQLKFCKNKGPGDFTMNCPKFDGQGRAYITKLDPFGGYERYVYPNISEFGNTPGDYYGEDDINNGFGAGDTDSAWSPELNRWYWLEWEIDTGTPGSTEGSYRIWIDGRIYFQLENVQVNKTGHGGFDYFELGHVWQTGFPTTDISMYWHSLSVWDQRPTNLPEGIAA